MAGFGRAGRNAVDTLLALHPKWRMVAVDKRPIVGWDDPRVLLEQGDAVERLDIHMGAWDEIFWIIPAVPFHLAFEWLLFRLSKDLDARRTGIPSGLNLPNSMVTQRGDMICSFAEDLCPPRCPEPPSFCPQTGNPRPTPLFRLLEEMKVDGYEVLGLRSLMLSPGVGGYRSGRLMQLYERVREARGRLLIYTACRCHGIVSPLEVL